MCVLNNYDKSLLIKKCKHLIILWWPIFGKFGSVVYVPNDSYDLNERLTDCT